MISDLTGAPQPVVVKLFSPSTDELLAWAPRVADALDRIQIKYKKPVVDIEDGIENTTSGPAVVFTVNPAAAAKGGFTTDQLTTIASAIVDGEPATAPVIINDKPYTLRVRYPAANRVFARGHEQHDDRQRQRRVRHSRLGLHVHRKCRARPKFSVTICKRKRKSRRAWKASIWAAASPRCRKQ